MKIESQAQHIEYALTAYFDDTLIGNDPVRLLIALRHYCDAKGLDYYKLADRSYELYLVERDETTRPVDKY